MAGFSDLFSYFGLLLHIGLRLNPGHVHYIQFFFCSLKKLKPSSLLVKGATVAPLSIDLAVVKDRDIQSNPM